MKEIKYYEVTELDEEGRRSVRSLGYFETRQAAEEVKENAFYAIQEKSISVYEGKNDYLEIKRKEVKEKVLKHLTYEEAKLIGLK